MCDHYQCEHLDNKPKLSLEEKLATLLRDNHGKPVSEIQTAINSLLVQNGLPYGSIILVDDTPQIPALTPDIIEMLKPRLASASNPPMLSEELLSIFEEPPFVPHQPGEMDPRNWTFEYLDTDCGHACTPDGCRGHETDIPVALNIGQVTLTFPDAEYPEQTKQICEVARYIEGLIKADQARRKEAEAHAAQIEYGTLDPSAKTVVRGREAMLQKIEEGYRLFGNILNPGIKFLRASGKPDLLYYDV